jgi:hypothetical protein
LAKRREQRANCKLSDEEADSAGPTAKWVVGRCQRGMWVLANDRVEWREGLKILRANECEYDIDEV